MTPCGGGWQRSSVLWLGGKEEEVDFISDYLSAESHRGCCIDHTLVATSGLAFIRTTAIQQVVFSWWRSQLGAGKWFYWYLWTGPAATLTSQNNKMSPLASATSATRPPWHSQECACQLIDSSSTKQLHRKDPANFLFPWPQGEGWRQQGSLCQMLWKRGIYKSTPTCIRDSQLCMMESAMARSVQAGQHLLWIFSDSICVELMLFPHDTLLKQICQKMFCAFFIVSL